jgi:D-alanyl-D-alanine endopeptidase (penicillin-binding protein 7)
MRRLLIAIALLSIAVPAVTWAAVNSDLSAVYQRRADLQRVFKEDGTVKSKTLAGRLAGLVDWAKKYGYKEHPEELAAYAPAAVAVAQAGATPASAAVMANAPVKSSRYAFDYGLITADKVLVLDADTKAVLVAKREHEQHPLASISKLMTATVALSRGAAMDDTLTLSKTDEVGGARLRVAVGSKLTVRQAFDAMLIGSANNAATAFSRSTGLAKADFAKAMNDKAAELGMSDTHFVDPSGIEVENVSTAADIAKLATTAFELPEVKRATTTAHVEMTVSGEPHAFNNTNALLTNASNGLTVMGGKTGYLEESKWNFVVKMTDGAHPPLLVVVLGSDTKNASFSDAERVARWVWRNYTWPKS